MSIWSSRCTFGFIEGFNWDTKTLGPPAPPSLDDQPYTDYLDKGRGDSELIGIAGGRHYVTDETLDQADRGGFIDLAATSMCALYRLSMEYPEDTEVELFLDRRQLEKLHRVIGELLDEDG